MKNKLYFIFLSALIPALVNALGLGKLELNSALNEPFEARIQLLSPTLDGLDSLEVNLADRSAFERARLDRPLVLSHLKFALRRSVDDEPDYIRVFSTEPIREPFLNFLVEINWANGRLYREYTALLDPPLYDPKSRAAEFTQKPELVRIDTSAAVNAGVSPSGVNYTGSDYGPITDSDTLWSIASLMRPDTSISVNRMMLALLRANPDAFFSQNINALKRGQILRVPNESELNAFSNVRALEEAKSQHAAWGTLKDNISSVVTERPETSSVSKPLETDAPQNAGTTSTPVATNPELKLLATNETNVKPGQASSVEPGSGQDLILAQESIAVLTQENLELKDQVKENEALLNDLERLLAIKDDEMAALQEQMAAQSEMITEQFEVAAEELEPVEQFEVAVEELEAIEEESVEKEKLVESFEQEEVIDVEQEPEPAGDSIMGMVNQYLGLIKDSLLSNSMIGMAVGGVLIVLILIIVFMKIRESVDVTGYISNIGNIGNIGNIVGQFFQNLGSNKRGDTDKEEIDSEGDTILSDSEPETDVLDSTLNLIDVLSESEAKALFGESEEPGVDEGGREGEEEEEPLQEVNTYLVFEQFEQAEEFVRNAINAEPENLAYHTKLLEVFYTSGNKKAYEKEAEILNNLVGGEGEHWNMATAMWQEMSPTRALFEEGDDKDDSPAETTSKFVDLTADEGVGFDDDSLNLDIGVGEGVESSVDKGEGFSDDPATVNQDGSMTESASEPEEVFDTTVELDMANVIAKEQAIEDIEDNVIDFDLATAESSDSDDDLSVDLTGSALNSDKQEQESESLDVPDEDSDEISFDFDTDEVTAPESPDDTDVEADLSVAAEDDLSTEVEEISDSEISLEDPDQKTVQESDDVMDFGIEEDTDNVDDDEEHAVFISKATESEEQSAEFEVATKLDLAKAYVELGDEDNARTILDEVMAEGNDEQKKQAEDLLGQI